MNPHEPIWYLDVEHNTVGAVLRKDLIVVPLGAMTRDEGQAALEHPATLPSILKTIHERLHAECPPTSASA
ncbi:MAG: hypothetical protein EBS05_11530 [Proteobacteria bacterium]|nr:hypothetical protein [Pseudomonadota bacterium]